MGTVVPKPYELIFEERPGYLYACVKAQELSQAMAMSWIGEVADKCAATHCPRLLLERDVPTEPNSYALVAINDFVGLRDGPVAFVNRHDPIGEKLRTQVEAGAASGAMVAYFTDVETAEAWLLAN